MSDTWVQFAILSLFFGCFPLLAAVRFCKKVALESKAFEDATDTSGPETGSAWARWVVANFLSDESRRRVRSRDEAVGEFDVKHLASWEYRFLQRCAVMAPLI